MRASGVLVLTIARIGTLFNAGPKPTFNVSRVSRGDFLTSRTVLSDDRSVKGSEFERRVQRLAKEGHLLLLRRRPWQGQPWAFVPGFEFTTLKDRKKELGKGLL